MTKTIEERVTRIENFLSINDVDGWKEINRCAKKVLAETKALRKQADGLKDGRAKAVQSLKELEEKMKEFNDKMKEK